MVASISCHYSISNAPSPEQSCASSNSSKGQEEKIWLWRPTFRISSITKTLTTIFHVLNTHKEIKLPQEKQTFPLNANMSLYCPYHCISGHNLDECCTFRDLVYDWHEKGTLDWNVIADQKKNSYSLQQRKSQKNYLVTHHQTKTLASLILMENLFLDTGRR